MDTAAEIELSVEVLRSDVGENKSVTFSVFPMDEPSMGLAPLVIKEMFSIIRMLRDEGATILLVEQNAKAALRLADRGYVLETGKVILEGSAADLLENEDVKCAYLGKTKNRYITELSYNFSGIIFSSL